MGFRKLRIAWSLVWGIVALLFIVLWILSLSAEDRFSGRISGPGFFRIYSSRGCLVAYFPGEPIEFPWQVTFRSGYWMQKSDSRLASIPRIHTSSQESWVTLPYWFLVAISSAVASIVWLPLKRFSLRTLLIATTLVAALLGLIVWATHG